ncbi:MAG: LysR family transcriptional regulator [Burkholderiaceae bacterium]|jgi:DNA-binding transcriptional LysR family regulator|nr:LysR family transcriptional regulator [Burkholderiaceae bacterium]
MTLVQLRHLLSLARTGSFSRSAAALFITQPALSRSIGALESELGQRLFDRVGRRSELTPFGREMAERAGELVLVADDLRERARRLSKAAGGSGGQGDEGTLRVGLGSGPGSMLMTPLLLQCALQHPRLQLQVARAATEQLVLALRERTLDALVVDARSLRPAPDLDTRELHEMRGAFLVRRGHPLARRRAPVDLALLRQYPVASTPLSDEVARVLVERYGPQAHPDVLVTLRCDELPSLVEVARRSDAVLLAIRAAAPDLAELRVTPELKATARFGLVTLRRRTEPPGLQTLRALMRERLRDAAA